MHYWQKIPVKSPNSQSRQIWDGLSILTILYSVYKAMFDQSFFPTSTLADNIDWIAQLDFVVQTFFWFDVVFNFFTAQFDQEGDLVYKKMTIAQMYLRTWFWIDVISNLPLGGGYSLIKGLRLLRFPRILLRWAYLGYSTKALNLFRLGVAITTSGHFVACAFYMVARLEEHKDENWTVVDGLYKECSPGANTTTGDTFETGMCDISSMKEIKFTRAYHYVSALYFAYATLTTVGYGDIKAKTSGERLVALVALVIGSAVFAGVVGTMTQMMESMDEIEENKLKKIKQLQYFIKSHHFPDALRAKLRRYYDLHFQQYKKELQMLDELPPSLRNECTAHIYAEEMRLTPFLRNASSVVRSEYMNHVDIRICCEGDYIVVQGQLIEEIFIVTAGTVGLVNNRGMVCRNYTKGSFFGEKCAFFANMLSNVSYRASTEVEVMCMPRDRLLKLLNNYDDFAEEFIQACEKREDHKVDKLDGASKFTSFNKNSAIMFRPITPPPGLNWEDERGMLDNPKRKFTFDEVYGDLSHAYSQKNMFDLITEMSKKVDKLQRKLNGEPEPEVINPDEIPPIGSLQNGDVAGAINEGEAHDE